MSHRGARNPIAPANDRTRSTTMLSLSVSNRRETWFTCSCDLSIRGGDGRDNDNDNDNNDNDNNNNNNNNNT
jgi:hypothetical protein